MTNRAQASSIDGLAMQSRLCLIAVSLLLAIAITGAATSALAQPRAPEQRLTELLEGARAKPKLDFPFLVPGELAVPVITLPPGIKSPGELLPPSSAPIVPLPPSTYSQSAIQWAFELKAFSGGVVVQHCSASASEVDGKIRIYTALHCVLDQSLEYYTEFLIVRPDATPQVLRLAPGAMGASFKIVQSATSEKALLAAKKKRVPKQQYFTKLMASLASWAEDGCAIEIGMQTWPAASWNRMLGTTACPAPSVEPGANVWGVLGGCNSPTSCGERTTVYQLYQLPFRVSVADPKPTAPWLAVDLVDNSQMMGGDSGGPLLVSAGDSDRLCAVIVATLGKTAYSYRLSF